MQVLIRPLQVNKMKSGILELRNRVMKKPNDIRIMTSHFELLTRTFLQKFFLSY